jgi:hypothetical protein
MAVLSKSCNLLHSNQMQTPDHPDASDKPSCEMPAAVCRTGICMLREQRVPRTPNHLRHSEFCEARVKGKSIWLFALRQAFRQLTKASPFVYQVAMFRGDRALSRWFITVLVNTGAEHVSWHGRRCSLALGEQVRNMARKGLSLIICFDCSYWFASQYSFS